MLVDIFLLEPYKGVSAGQHTQLPAELADELIAKGIAVAVDTEKKTKVESTKKVGK